MSCAAWGCQPAEWDQWPCRTRWERWCSQDPGALGYAGLAAAGVEAKNFYHIKFTLNWHHNLGWITAVTHKKQHLWLKHHSDGSRRSDGRSTGRNGEAKLDVPFELCSLVRKLKKKKFIFNTQISWKTPWNKGEQTLIRKMLYFERVPHQFQLHDAHTVPEDVGGGSQQLCKGIKGVEFEGRTSNLKAKRYPVDKFYI